MWVWGGWVGDVTYITWMCVGVGGVGDVMYITWMCVCVLAML